MRKALRTAAVTALTGAALAVALPVSASNAPLKGEVGPSFKIEVNRGGGDLRTIRAGTYRMAVEDKSSIHDFHLVGPGLNRSTGVAFTGEQTWTVRLRKGVYRYFCDPHASSMRGSFRVT